MGLGRTETPLLQDTHKVSCALEARAKSVISYDPEPDLPACLRGTPEQVGAGCGSLWAQGPDGRGIREYSLA